MRPNTARKAITKIQQFRGIELLPDSAYSPDLASSDYHPFGSIAHFLLGRNFETFETVEVDLTESIASITRDWYRREIINLAERWLKTIESDGLYFEQ